jgi:hypothetical protein
LKSSRKEQGQDMSVTESMDRIRSLVRRKNWVRDKNTGAGQELEHYQE